MGGTERATAAARHRCRRAAAIRSEWQNFYLKLRFFSSWPLCRDRGAYFSYLGMFLLFRYFSYLGIAGRSEL